MKKFSANKIVGKVKEIIDNIKDDKRCILRLISYVIVSLLLVIPLAKKIILIDDLPFHLNRIQSLANSIKSGNYFPMIYGSTLNNYGYANGIFYPQLMLYVPALLVCAGIKTIPAYLVYAFIINFVGCFVAYYSCKWTLIKISDYLSLNDSQYKIDFDKISKFSYIFSILYVTNGYRIFNLVKGSVGQFTGITFFPIVIVGALEIFTSSLNYKGNKDALANNKKHTKWWILTLGMTLLLNCHILSVFLAVIFIGTICLINISKIKYYLFPLIKATVSTILINAFILFPMIEQMVSDKFYYNIRTPLGTISSHAMQIIANPNSIISLLIAIMLIIGFLYSIFSEKNKKIKIHKIIVYIIIITTFAMTNLFPWQLLDGKPLIKTIQFPSRILLFSSSFIYFYLTGYVIKLLENTKKRKIGFVVIFAILLLPFQMYFSINENNGTKNFANYKVSSENIGQGEYLPSNFNIKNCNSKEKKKIRKESICDLNEKIVKYNYQKRENTAIIKYKIINKRKKNKEKVQDDNSNIPGGSDNSNNSVISAIPVISNNNTNILLELPITYYKGYKCTWVIDNSSSSKKSNSNYTKEIPISKSKNGLIQIKLKNDENNKKKEKSKKEEKGTLKIKYQYTSIQILSFVISTASIISIVILSLISLIISKKNKKI